MGIDFSNGSLQQTGNYMYTNYLQYHT